MKAADWIDRLKAAREWDSDYRVAKELDVGRATISKYRRGATPTFDDDTAVKVAAALHVEPEIIILDQVAERTKSEPARAALTGLLERIAGKVLAGGGGAGARGRLDITSVTQATDAGELPTPRSKGIRIVSTTQKHAGHSALSPLQLLARALSSALAPAPMVAA